MKRPLAWYFALFAAGLAFVFLSCFAPLDGKDGNGLITIGIPGRTVINAAEAPNLSYNISLTGPGGEITHQISGGQSLSWSVSVLPGLWTVTVRAYNSGGALRGTGWEKVTVMAGAAAEARIKLTTTTAVYNYAQLAAAFAAAENGELILVSGNIELADKVDFSGSSSPGTTVTLAADTGTRTITRGSAYTLAGLFFDVNNDIRLVLGVPGNPFAAGTLILDGGDYHGAGPAAAALIDVQLGAYLTMNDNTILQNNENAVFAGGGVHVNGGEFTMNGGTIRGNRTGVTGGGVNVDFGSVLTMNGGTISGNHAASDGGGVNIDNSSVFTMNGGTISGNRAVSNGGGGVYIGYSSDLTMNGGTISGNRTDNNGGGVATAYSRVCTINGGTISGNHADSDGGGVYIAGGSEVFYMKGGTVQGNTAVMSAPGMFVQDAFNMEGNALADNIELFAPGVDVITISGDLTGNPVANITGASSFSSGNQILDGDSGLIARNYWRFTVNGFYDHIYPSGFYAP